MSIFMKKDQKFIIGFRKWLIYSKIACHVISHFFIKILKRDIALYKYPIVLYRFHYTENFCTFQLKAGKTKVNLPSLAS